MKRICLLIMVAALSACKNSATEHPPFNLEQVKQIIASNNKLYRIPIISGDSSSFADLHHPATINMPPGQPVMKGPAAMGAMVRSMPAMGVTDYKVTTTNVYGGPDNVIEEGRYEVDSSGNKAMEKGKYIVIWRQDKGRWKIYRSIWNTDGSK
jgi:ketosteroid isomerase-like protein